MLMFVTVFSAQFLGLMVVFGKVKGICTVYNTDWFKSTFMLNRSVNVVIIQFNLVQCCFSSD